jgi:membrane fusion protein (multidrug efflux system)
MPPVSLLLSDGSEYSEKGKVEIVSGLIDTETGSATFRAAFPNPTGLIRSGGSATIQIPQNLNSVIVIPQSATFELQNKRFAFIVKPDNTVLSASVDTKASDDGQSFIVTKGLKAGDKIVLEGVSLLKDSTKIKPKIVANILK